MTRLIAAVVLALFAGTVASLSDLAAATNGSKPNTHQGNPKSKSTTRG